MADVELVIKIPEEIYESRYGEECDEKDCLIIDAFTYAIANGIPLPKGHDRLVEANAVIKALFSKKTIDDVPTIIEADKEQSNGQI